MNMSGLIEIMVTEFSKIADQFVGYAIIILFCLVILSAIVLAAKSIFRAIFGRKR